jgi:hypothetical protein
MGHRIGAGIQSIPEVDRRPLREERDRRPQIEVARRLPPCP